MIRTTTNPTSVNGHSSLKRSHSAPGVRIPELPKITGDIILEVFTHSSLQGSNERLVELGRTVSEAVVTHLLFHRTPFLGASGITVSFAGLAVLVDRPQPAFEQIQRKDILSTQNIDGWARAYSLRGKVRWDHAVVPSLDSPEEGRRIFYSYVGGLYTEKGLDVVRDWLTGLVGLKATHPQPQSASPQWYMTNGIPDSPPQKKIRSEPDGVQPPALPARIRSKFTPTRFPPNPLSPALPNAPFLPLFTQAAQQRGVSIDYAFDFIGPPHCGKWRAKCIVDGIGKGEGVDASKQRAKEEAARQAYHAMGWAPHG